MWPATVHAKANSFEYSPKAAVNLGTLEALGLL
jgi:hypothetical protein